MVENEPVTMKVFYSYAREDRVLRDELEKHLGNLRRQGFIMVAHFVRLTRTFREEKYGIIEGRIHFLK